MALYEAKRTKLTRASSTTRASPRPSKSPATTRRRTTRRRSRPRSPAPSTRRTIGTRSHSETVAELCVAIGERLGFDGDGLERLRLAGLLHDVGKIGVPDAILQKPAALAADERDADARARQRRARHPRLRPSCPSRPSGCSTTTSASTAPAIPPGCAAHEIPLESRIIAVADAFEAMTGTRPYQDEIEVGEALDELARARGDAVRRALRRRAGRLVAQSAELAA